MNNWNRVSGVLAKVAVTLGIVLACALFAPVKAQAAYLADTNPNYSYTDMQADINALQAAYPGLVTVGSIGGTADGRNIYKITIGNPSAAKHILMVGSTHAREYITTRLLMKQTEDFVAALAADTGAFGGTSYKQLTANCAIDVVPMLNPDGVSISQMGLAGILNPAVQQTVLTIAASNGVSAAGLPSYLRTWKANAQGIDINKTFDAAWEACPTEPIPSSANYKGTAPFQATETQALVGLVGSTRYSRIISYHAMGNLIYWNFGQTGELLNQTYTWGSLISQLTGYYLEGNYATVSPAGFKDWCLSKVGIPSITIEVGSGAVPVDPGQFGSIYARNKDVLAATLYGL